MLPLPATRPTTPRAVAETAIPRAVQVSTRAGRLPQLRARHAAHQRVAGDAGEREQGGDGAGHPDQVLPPQQLQRVRLRSVEQVPDEQAAHERGEEQRPDHRMPPAVRDAGVEDLPALLAEAATSARRRGLKPISCMKANVTTKTPTSSPVRT